MGVKGCCSGRRVRQRWQGCCRRRRTLGQGQGGRRQGEGGGQGRGGASGADRQAGEVEAEGRASGDGGCSKGRGGKHDEGKAVLCAFLVLLPVGIMCRVFLMSFHTADKGIAVVDPALVAKTSVGSKEQTEHLL